MLFKFDNERPIYIQLVEQLQLYVISGKIPPGEKLPSVRDLAMEAQVNPNTMQRALAELEDLRLIHTERTNGKYITDDQRLIHKYREQYATLKTEKYFTEMRDLGFSDLEIISFLAQKGEKF